MPNWTDAQRQAIEARNNETLVARCMYSVTILSGNIFRQQMLILWQKLQMKPRCIPYL